MLFWLELTNTVRSWAGVTGIWASQVSQWVENLPADLIPESEDPLEKEMATPSSILAWRIPWAEEHAGPQTTGSQSVGHGRAAEHACTLGSVSSRAACYAVMCTDRATLRLCEEFYLIRIILLCREFYHCPPSQIRHLRQGPWPRQQLREQARTHAGPFPASTRAFCLHIPPGCTPRDLSWPSSCVWLTLHQGRR